MKKFLSKITFIAVAILSATGFASCNNSDDDPYVPTPQPTVQEQPKYEVVPAYAAAVSENILNMYDVKVTLHSGDKSKEVELTKANGEAVANNSEGKTITCYKYVFTEINGQKGIGAAEVKLTPKADIKTIIASMPENEPVISMYGAKLYKAQFDTNGKLVEDYGIAMHREYLFPAQLVQTTDEGKMVYEHEIELFEMFLTK